MIKISKIGLGTVQFGLDYGISNSNGKTDTEEIKHILETASQNGIECLDTASAYGNAEEVLGLYNLNHFNIVSKFMPPTNGDSISKQLYQSLKKLNQVSIYAYLAHRPLQVLENPEQWKELQQLKLDGIVQKIGFSLNEPKEIYQLIEKGFVPDLIQVPYNYFDRRFENAIKDLRTSGCEIHTRSAFLQGLFFINPLKLSDYFDEIKPQLLKLQKNSFLSASLLKFVLDKPFIDKVIIGVENKLQLIENIKNLEKAPMLSHLENKVSENILIPSRWPKN